MVVEPPDEEEYGSGVLYMHEDDPHQANDGNFNNDNDGGVHRDVNGDIDVNRDMNCDIDGDIARDANADGYIDEDEKAHQYFDGDVDLNVVNVEISRESLLIGYGLQLLEKETNETYDTNNNNRSALLGS